MPDQVTGYPILLHLRDRQVAVIGGGRVATRKVRHLLGAGALVLVISPEVSGELQTYADDNRIELITSRYERDLFNDHMPILVIAATDDARVNQIVAQDAHRVRALCNVANGSGESDFSNMALISQPPLTIALSTSGASPAMLRRLKTLLEPVIGEEYAILADWLGEIRGPLKAQLQSQAERHTLFERLLDSDVLELLRSGRPEQARQLFQEIVAEGVSA